jgi:hypothetical protein
MSSAFSGQLWDISHPNVPTREMTKQSLLEDKESYLRDGALVVKKNVIIWLAVQKKKHRSKFVKTGLSDLANQSI